MAKTILEEALEDANTLKKTAIENAKNVLVEAISPKIKEFVESQLGECMPAPNMEAAPEQGALTLKLVPVAAAGMEGESAMMPPQDGHSDEADDMDLLGKLGLLGGEESGEQDQFGGEQSSEDDDGEQDDMDEQFMSEEAQLESKEKDEKDEDDKDDKKMDEVVEITNEDLKSALAEVLGSLKTEATVTKGFGDVENATIPAAGGPGKKGIADEKSGEHHWKDVAPPAAKDLTVKEAKQYITAVRKENDSLKKENAEYKKAYGVLRSKLQEVNLFNSKLLFTQKLLNLSELNNKQRLAVIEAFDRAASMREVELVYRSLSESFKIAGVLSESKQAQASKAKASRLSAPSSTVLKEAMVKEEKETLTESKEDVFTSRMQELAGIVD